MTSPEHGVDLETYARVLADLCRAPASQPTVLGHHGLTEAKWHAAAASWKARLLADASEGKPENLRAFAAAYRKQCAVVFPAVVAEPEVSVDETSTMDAIVATPALPFGLPSAARPPEAMRAAPSPDAGETMELCLDILDQTLPFAALTGVDFDEPSDE